MKKTYTFEVIETVRKMVCVEADSFDEAEDVALDENMEKNFDCYEREAILISED